ncbi:hypothetical protein [Pseudoteredinibacter isoporae]|uniref:DUF560 domain-containing protein n=1 Tax=Pseudoteredinibacter isoporae TaxID=570281 RepID=A0A7X0JRF8_9GAMM|nr:hypothetical protein [Pseudoteredinibacter isoporae]MBB6520041.1 hypothetical protein [Pseudoteredinibacter isoporae]NHO85613.1 hypothetical protein [Pseudoteredinibacter isoporae]NIB25935.1 hypothetical protein [Pseudoteredinibacter isoporae]
MIFKTGIGCVFLSLLLLPLPGNAGSGSPDRLEDALKAIAQGNFSSAERKLILLLGEDPSAHRARLELARILALRGSCDRALGQIRILRQSVELPETVNERVDVIADRCIKRFKKNRLYSKLAYNTGRDSNALLWSDPSLFGFTSVAFLDDLYVARGQEVFVFDNYGLPIGSDTNSLFVPDRTECQNNGCAEGTSSNFHKLSFQGVMQRNMLTDSERPLYWNTTLKLSSKTFSEDSVDDHNSYQLNTGLRRLFGEHSYLSGKIHTRKIDRDNLGHLTYHGFNVGLEHFFSAGRFSANYHKMQQKYVGPNSTGHSNRYQSITLHQSFSLSPKLRLSAHLKSIKVKSRAVDQADYNYVYPYEDNTLNLNYTAVSSGLNVNYSYNSRLNFGLSGRYIDYNYQQQSDRKFYRLGLESSYKVNSRWKLLASYRREHRSHLGPNADDRNLFTLGVEWKPNGKK